MLILTRQDQEGVVALLPDGRRIRVSVAKIDRGRVRLGFEAPTDIKFFREELLPATLPLPEPTPPRVA